MKTLKITWLDDCQRCGFDEYLLVTTEKGIGCWLFMGDQVKCPRCEFKGEIEVEGNCAYVGWTDEPQGGDL